MQTSQGQQWILPWQCEAGSTGADIGPEATSVSAERTETGSKTSEKTGSIDIGTASSDSAVRFALTSCFSKSTRARSAAVEKDLELYNGRGKETTNLPAV